VFSLDLRVLCEIEFHALTSEIKIYYLYGLFETVDYWQHAKQLRYTLIPVMILSTVFLSLG